MNWKTVYTKLCAPASPHTDGLIAQYTREVPDAPCPPDSFTEAEELAAAGRAYGKWGDGNPVLTASEANAESKRRKETPIFSGFLAYWPDAVGAVASHSFVNNEKHNPGEPLHWSRDKSNDHLDSLARHLTDLGKAGPDPDERIELLKAIVWRGLAELQLTIERVAEGAEAGWTEEPLRSRSGDIWRD